MRSILKYMADIIVLLVIYAFFLYPKWKSRGKREMLTNTLMYVYLAMVVAVTLMPIICSLPTVFNHPYVPMNLMPFDDYIHSRGDTVRQIVLNVIMLMPFGFLLPLVSKSRKRESIFYSARCTFLLSLGIELLQPLINPGRASDVTDLITNTLGGILGYLLYRLFRPLTRAILRRLD